MHRTPAAIAILALATAANAQPLEGVIILDFEGADDGSIVPSAEPINALDPAALLATSAGTVDAIQTDAGDRIPLNTPLLAGPGGGGNLAVSLGDDAGAITDVTLAVTGIEGAPQPGLFIGPGSGSADDAFDGVAATSVAADFFEFAPGVAVTFTYSGLTPGDAFTIASFSSNTDPSLTADNIGTATVGGEFISFDPAATSDAGTGTLFAFEDVVADASGNISITFEAGNGPTYVSGFFIQGAFVPAPGAAAVLALAGLNAARRRRA